MCHHIMSAAVRLVLSIGLCVGAATLPAPGAAANTPEAGTSTAAAAPSLPRQFVVEVAAGGVLFADGTRLGAPSELGRWAQRAASLSRFAGAVVFGDPERDGSAIAEVVALLEQSGFAQVRSAGRPAPRALSAARANGPVPVVWGGRPHPAPAPRVAPTPSAPPVTLASAGLHVDGLLNREPHRGRLVRLFERQFDTFKRCHARAEPHAEGASFGVDLLIPKEGGLAKVRETRTRLTNKDFQACMRRAFEAIRFTPPASERPEVVSYSVLFKPAAR
jgi:hypothetical protein